jgi:hypothetical protein
MKHFIGRTVVYRHVLKHYCNVASEPADTNLSVGIPIYAVPEGGPIKCPKRLLGTRLIYIQWLVLNLVPRSQNKHFIGRTFSTSSCDYITVTSYLNPQTPPPPPIDTRSIQAITRRLRSEV